MWCIVGNTYCHYCDSEDEVIATFDTKESAEEYELKSRLKRPTQYSKYREKSLLFSFKDISIIRYYGLDEPIHEPRLE